MIDWLLSLTIFEQVLISVAFAATFVLLVQIFLVLVNFYGTDKLNAEPENLEFYEKIANNDSDLSKNKVRVLSVKTINIFLATSIWVYFIFKNIFLDLPLLIVFAIFIGVSVSVLYAVIYYLAKRKKKVK